jgi:hypothetical protein
MTKNDYKNLANALNEAKNTINMKGLAHFDFIVDVIVHNFNYDYTNFNKEVFLKAVYK